jgi:hypothetical protein
MTQRAIGVLTAALVLLADTAPLWAQRYRPLPPPPPPVRPYGGGAGGGGGARTLPSNPRPRPTPSGPSRPTSTGPSNRNRPANDNARRPGSGATGGATVRRRTPISASGVTRNTTSGTAVRLSAVPAKTSPIVQQARANARARLTALRLLRQRQLAARRLRQRQARIAAETREREEEERLRERRRAAELASVPAGRAATPVAAGGGRGGRSGPPPAANDNVRPAPGAPPAGLTTDVPGGFRFTSKWRDGDYEYEEISGPLKPPSEVQAVRSRSAQSAMSKGTGDHAGHRIAAKFGGPEDARNMSLQNANVNTYAPKDLQVRFGGKSGNYKQMEDDWERKLEVGVKIDVRVRDRYRRGDPRPEARIVRWTETYQDGEKVESELVFLNPESPQSRGDVP